MVRSARPPPRTTAITAALVSFHPLTLRFSCEATEARFRTAHLHESTGSGAIVVLGCIVASAASVIANDVQTFEDSHLVSLFLAILPVSVFLWLRATPTARWPRHAYVLVDAAMVVYFAGTHLVSAAVRAVGSDVAPMGGGGDDAHM